MVYIVCSLLLVLECNCQNHNDNNGIEFLLAFKADTACFGDSLDLELTFLNTTDSLIHFSPDAIIGITHKHEGFITYDSSERIMKSLSNTNSPDNKVSLLPDQFYNIRYKILIDSAFFYSEENTLIAFYHLHSDKSQKNRKRRCKNEVPLLSLWSSSVKLFVNNN